MIFESFLKLEKIALVPPYVFAQIFEKFSKKNIRGDQGKNLAIDYVIMGGEEGGQKIRNFDYVISG